MAYKNWADALAHQRQYRKRKTEERKREAALHPPPPLLRKAFRYRLYPNRAQAEALTGQLAAACTLYNAALQERRDAWRMGRNRVTHYDQVNQLKSIRAAGDTDLASFNACQDVLRRVDLAFQAFFRRRLAGEKAGFPRFKPRSRYDSYTFTHYGAGCKLRDNGRLYVQGVGELKLKLHRPLEGVVRTLALKREAGRWYASFGVEVPVPAPMPPTGQVVGIDIGLASFAVTSDGTVFDNPQHYRDAQAKLRRASRKMTRRKKGSNRRSKAVQSLQRVHAHVRHQRADFHHKVSRKLVNAYDLIAVEDLNIHAMGGTMLGKSIYEAGWAGFLYRVTYKAEWAGRTLVKVNAYGTSQRCPCGAAVPKRIKQRWHRCPNCGLSVGRDHASALEILRLGLSHRDETWPRGASVSREAVSAG